MKKINLLSRAEMKKVAGGNTPPCNGNGLCRIMYYDANHVYQEKDILGASASANAECVSLINNQGATRCWYDCDCDGWGN